jgi:Rrf2 family protein
MFGMSQSVGYAIQALACLERGTCETRFVRDIAVCAKVPPAYLAKVFKKLGDAGIVASKRGWAGGTCLARPASEISLWDIAQAVDGPNLMANCMLGFDCACDGCGCPTQDFWKNLCTAVEAELRRTTLADTIAKKRAQSNKPGVARPGSDCCLTGPQTSKRPSKARAKRR